MSDLTWWRQKEGGVVPGQRVIGFASALPAQIEPYGTAFTADGEDCHAVSSLEVPDSWMDVR